MTERVYIEKAGCNRRQLDLERIRAYLELNGYCLVNKPELADRILVSTCAFKKKEEDDSVARIESLREYDDKTVVFGCLPDIAPDRFEPYSHMPKVAPKELEQIQDHFAGSQQSFATVSDAHIIPRGKVFPGFAKLRRSTITAGTELGSKEFLRMVVETGGERLRALNRKTPEPFYLLICRGCMGKCSYCAIRRSIGNVKSKPVALICEDLKVGYDQGYRDFVILGDDPGCYGVDIGSSFSELLEALATKASECEREIHSSSFYGHGSGNGHRSGKGRASGNGNSLSAKVSFHLKEVHPKFLIANQEALLAGQGMARVKTFLFPIQSGSDRVLQAMQREHTMTELSAALNPLRQLYPDMFLSTQIIVGFPGESNGDYMQSLDAVCKTGFQAVTVFPYDDKEGTDASTLDGKIAQKVIRRRLRYAFKYFRQRGVQAYYSCPP